jgi:hypothetical protein
MKKLLGVLAFLALVNPALSAETVKPKTTQTIPNNARNLQIYCGEAKPLWDTWMKKMKGVVVVQGVTMEPVEIFFIIKFPDKTSLVVVTQGSGKLLCGAIPLDEIQIPREQKKSERPA